MSYATLVERLAEIGVMDNELNLRNKVSRGRFTAVSLMQCLRAIGVEWIHIPSDLDGAAGKGEPNTRSRERNARHEQRLLT